MKRLVCLLAFLSLLAAAITGCQQRPVVAEAAPPIPLPTLVELPGGQAYIGDQSNQGDLDERPVQEITLKPFFISQNEITFNEYDAFAKATGRLLPVDATWGRGSKPVINVSWGDAEAYTLWLSRQTDSKWRLPSELEWEYAARAGQLSQFQTGNQPESLCRVANIADQSARNAGNEWQISQCNDNVVNTSSVGLYPPNRFGLHDMHGNVWEWTSDCYRLYSQPTSKRRACEMKVIRGGSFQTSASSARFSNREAMSTNTRINQIGFRVVKEK